MEIKRKAPRPRNPDRAKRSTASVSVPWELYDRLNALADKEAASIAQVIDALVDEHNA